MLPVDIGKQHIMIGLVLHRRAFLSSTTEISRSSFHIVYLKKRSAAEYKLFYFPFIAKPVKILTLQNF